MKKKMLSIVISAGINMPHDNGATWFPGSCIWRTNRDSRRRYYSEPLTTYLVGWRDPSNIEATLDFIAPPVRRAGEAVRVQEIQ